MNLMLSALADNNPHRHADRDTSDVGVDDVGRDFRTFLEGDDRDDVRGPVLEVWVVRFVENDKGADRSPT